MLKGLGRKASSMNKSFMPKESEKCILTDGELERSKTITRSMGPLPFTSAPGVCCLLGSISVSAVRLLRDVDTARREGGGEGGVSKQTFPSIF